MRPGLSIRVFILAGTGLSALPASAEVPFRMVAGDVPEEPAHFRMMASDVIEYSGTESAGTSEITRHTGEEVHFRDQSTADQAQIITNAGGAARFFDQATAGSALITNNGGTSFAGSATAGDAVIVNNGTGDIAFTDASTGGNAAIENSGGIEFSGTATAGGATVTNNETGRVIFSGTSDAGSNQITNSGSVEFRENARAGTGSLTNNETGAISFAGTSSADSALIANSGILTFMEAATLANGEIVNNIGGTATFSDNATAASGRIANAARLSFSGNATAASASILTQTGGTTLFKGNASGGQADFEIQDGGTLDFSGLANGGTSVGTLLGAGGAVYLGANELRVSGNGQVGGSVGGISDGGAYGGTGGSIVKTGAGTLRLEGTNTYTGRTLVEAGTLQAASENALAPRSAVTVEAGAALDIAGFDQEIGSLAGDGTVDLAAELLTLGGDGTSTEFSGTFAGAGGIAKTGAGTFTISGISPLLRAADIRDGTLRVTGDIASAAIDVAAGGRLSGSGTVGGTNVAAGGTIAPGAANTILSIAGDLAIADGGTYAVTIEGAFSDSLAVSGTASLAAGSRLSLSFSGAFDPAARYEILTAAAGLTGTFGEVVTDFAFLRPELAYGPNTLTLTLERNGLGFADIGRTPNQRETGRGLESAGAGNAAFDALLLLSDAEARRALDQLSGEIHASLHTGLIEDARTVSDTMAGRLALDGRVEPGPDFWTRAHGMAARGSGDGNAARLERRSGGLLAGFDAPLGEWRVGMLAGYSVSDMDSPGRNSSVEVETAHLGIYGGRRLGPLALRTGAALAAHKLDVERGPAFAGFGDRVTARYDALTLQAFAEAGYRVEFRAWAVEPFARLEHIRVETDGFREEGGDAALTAAASASGATFARLGLRAETGFVLGETPASLHVAAGWRHALHADTPRTDTAFSGGSRFSALGVPIARDSLSIEAGARFYLSSAMRLGLTYFGDFASGEASHAAMAELSVSF